MGTNYYWNDNVCRTCGRSDKTLHIGKSSEGWPFVVHVIPERHIFNFADWCNFFVEHVSGTITDEYGAILTPTELLQIVQDRRKNKDNVRVLKALNEFPNYFVQDTETGDTLSPGEFS